MLRADAGEPGSGDFSPETASLGAGCGEPLPGRRLAASSPAEASQLVKLLKTATWGATPQSKQYWS